MSNVNLSLSEEDSTACIATKATKCKTDTKYLSFFGAEAKVALIVKYSYFLSRFFSIAYFNYKSQTNIYRLFIRYFFKNRYF